MFGVRVKDQYNSMKSNFETTTTRGRGTGCILAGRQRLMEEEAMPIRGM